MRVSKGVAGLVMVAAMMMAAMSPRALADSKNPADYPLRLHIFGRSQTSFYYHRTRSLDETQGDGRANLYENGEARGLDFNYQCDYKVRASFGYETYPARWKKQGKQLVVLLPVFGQAGKFFTCDFNADMKDFAYAEGRDGMRSEPVAEYKLWMQRHDYDPEHGKDVPVRGKGGEPSPMPPQEGPGEPAPPPPPPVGAPAPQR
ncbi:hypothetical protein [Granulicella sp. L46]|uniref:hypothetical protein n=1 Tax=Granulicella sp. L46 TaxID=1641865 RepID=UPI00131DF3FD|nr:hypothetical protein [Granulicella sp. L46]